MIVLDNKGGVCEVMFTHKWSRDKSGAPCIDWWITLPDGDTYRQPMPVFTDWWPEKPHTDVSIDLEIGLIKRTYECGTDIIKGGANA